MNPIEASCICIQKIVTASGRATRSEFWGFSLFVFIYIFFFRDSLLKHPDISPVWIVNMIISSILNTALSNAVRRRLHDIGKSGWSLLMIFTIIGIPIFIYWLTFPSEPKDNKYGKFHKNISTPKSHAEIHHETPSDEEVMAHYNNSFFEKPPQQQSETIEPPKTIIASAKAPLNNTQQIRSFGKRNSSMANRKMN
jgi:uncharacterized membrane protein YhaH (DUF805 family)